MFVFFGLVAVLGTQYTQALRVDWVGLVAAVTMGCLSSAVLVANNLRDIPTDAQSGKITLAVRLGDARTRRFYVALLAGRRRSDRGAGAGHAVVSGRVGGHPTGGAGGPAGSHGTAWSAQLIPVLRDTGLTMLVWAIAVAVALAFGAGF